MKMTDDAKEVAEAYNQFGRIYHESRIKGGRLFNEFLDMPATLALIPKNLSQVVALDAGCGSGIYSKILAQRGAAVVGIDVSETMISIANAEKLAEENIIYRIGDLNNTQLDSNGFDLIICNYVLENISSLNTVFNEFYRLLKAHGECIFSISHPLRATSRPEEANGHEIWRFEDYYDKSTRISDFGHGLKVKKYKRTISDYLTAAITAGFIINHFSEPQPIVSGQAQNPKAYEAAMRLPQLLLVKMQKSS